MRRVSIGIELVAAPDVLVLDEPTSGLDSVSASRLIKLLKSLTEGENKTTIIASIHQPSSALYHSFSQICLLSNPLNISKNKEDHVQKDITLRTIYSRSLLDQVRD
jgi:ABC-type multidrug transport system ATPase subunit